VPLGPVQAAPPPGPDGKPPADWKPPRVPEQRVYELAKGHRLILTLDAGKIVGLSEEEFPEGPKGVRSVELPGRSGGAIAEPDDAEMKMVIYDVQDLVEAIIQDFTAPALGEPIPGPTDAETKAEKRPRITEQELLKRIRALLPAERPAGPSIEFRGGKAVVVAQPAAHREIAGLIRQLRGELLLQVHVEARFLGGDISAALRQAGLADSGALKPDEAAALLKAASEAKGVEVLFAPRLACYSGQRAHLWAGERKSYTAGYGEAGDKVAGSFLTGAALEVRPVASADRKHVTLQLRPAMCREIRMDARKTPQGTVEVPVLRVLKADRTVTLLDGASLLLKLEETRPDPTGKHREPVWALVTARLIQFEEEKLKER
jgi:hypothetical protein